MIAETEVFNDIVYFILGAMSTKYGEMIVQMIKDRKEVNMATQAQDMISNFRSIGEQAGETAAPTSVPAEEKLELKKSRELTPKEIKIMNEEIAKRAINYIVYFQDNSTLVVRGHEVYWNFRESVVTIIQYKDCKAGPSTMCAIPTSTVKFIASEDSKYTAVDPNDRRIKS